MLRRLALIASVLAVTTFAAAPADATVPPPSGTFSCTITGNFVFTPPLSYAHTVDDGHVRTAARGSNCDHSGVTGGKAPITDVFIRGLGALLPGASCNGLFFDANPPRLLVKYQGRNAKNHTMTVATTRLDLDTSSLGGGHWDFTYAAPASGPFAGSTLHVHATYDRPTVLNACNSPDGLRLMQYTGTITVP